MDKRLHVSMNGLDSPLITYCGHVVMWSRLYHFNAPFWTPKLK